MAQASGILGMGWIRSLLKRLPANMKRAIIIVSVFAKIKDETMLDDQTIHKLNKLMKLCESDSSLLLPIQFSNVIYQGRTSEEICNVNVLKPHLSDEQMQDAINGLIAYTPDWLRHEGDTPELEADFRRLLSNKELVLG